MQFRYEADLNRRKSIFFPPQCENTHNPCPPKRMRLSIPAASQKHHITLTIPLSSIFSQQKTHIIHSARSSLYAGPRCVCVCVCVEQVYTRGLPFCRTLCSGQQDSIPAYKHHDSKKDTALYQNHATDLSKRTFHIAKSELQGTYALCHPAHLSCHNNLYQIYLMN